MIFTSEYVYNNPKLNEINKIIENAQLKYEREYGYNYYRKVDIECIVKFYDKIKNENEKHSNREWKHFWKST